MNSGKVQPMVTPASGGREPPDDATQGHAWRNWAFDAKNRHNAKLDDATQRHAWRNRGLTPPTRQCAHKLNHAESWRSIVAKDPIRGRRPPTITTFISCDPTFTGENANHLSFSGRRTFQCRLGRSLLPGTSPPLIHSRKVS